MSNAIPLEDELAKFANREIRIRARILRHRAQKENETIRRIVSNMTDVELCETETKHREQQKEK